MEWSIPSNTQMIRGIPIGTLNDLLNRVAALEAGGGGGGSGFQRPISGVVDGSNTVFEFTTAPNALVVDETKTIQKLQSDGVTANWTGTTTITLTQSIPQFDLFAIA